MSVRADMNQIYSQSSYGFDPTNCDDPVNPGVQDVTNSKKSSWKIPSIRKLATGALAIQAAAMAPKAEAGPIEYGLCVKGCGLVIPAYFLVCVAGCAPLLAIPAP